MVALDRQHEWSVSKVQYKTLLAERHYAIPLCSASSRYFEQERRCRRTRIVALSLWLKQVLNRVALFALDVAPNNLDSIRFP